MARSLQRHGPVPRDAGGTPGRTYGFTDSAVGERRVAPEFEHSQHDLFSSRAGRFPVPRGFLAAWGRHLDGNAGRGGCYAELPLFAARRSGRGKHSRTGNIAKSHDRGGYEMSVSTGKQVLALFGGAAVRTNPFAGHPVIGPEERKEVAEVLDTGPLSGFIAQAGAYFLGGPKVKKLEGAFREFFGMPHAVAMNSATSCLHAALAALGCGPGDEVVVTPYTMSA